MIQSAKLISNAITVIAVSYFALFPIGPGIASKAIERSHSSVGG
jgi:hypothetical protein